MRIITTILMLCLSGIANAGGYGSEVANFFNLYEKGQKSEAVDAIYSTNPWMTLEVDAIQNMKTQFEGIEKIVGNYNGNVLLDKTDIKDRFVHLTYLALYDRQPVRMEFQFYRPKSDWIIYSFSFDIEFDDEIETGTREKIARGE